MTNASFQDLLAATSFAYVECDVPDGVTLAEWRHLRNRARPGRRRSLVAILHHRRVRR